jgi:hypothetical protein
MGGWLIPVPDGVEEIPLEFDEVPVGNEAPVDGELLEGNSPLLIESKEDELELLPLECEPSEEELAPDPDPEEELEPEEEFLTDSSN